MGEQDIRKSIVAMRDQLSELGDTIVAGVWDYDETIGLEEQSTIIKTQGIGTQFILDSPTNSILDSASCVLGDGYKDTAVVQRVVNPNNTFIDRLRDTEFKDTTNTSGTNWDTTNFRWEFTDGDTGQTLSIFKNQEAISYIYPHLVIEGVKVIMILDTTTNPDGVRQDIT